MFRTLVLLLGFIFGGAVYADEVVKHELTWSPSTTRTDGTDLLVTDIGGYRVYLDTTGIGDNLLMHADIADGVATTYEWTFEVPAGTTYSYVYAVTVYDLGGMESDFSNMVLKSNTVLSSARPGNPTEVGVKSYCARGCDEVLQ